MKSEVATVWGMISICLTNEQLQPQISTATSNFKVLKLKLSFEVEVDFSLSCPKTNIHGI